VTEGRAEALGVAGEPGHAAAAGTLDGAPRRALPHSPQGQRAVSGVPQSTQERAPSAFSVAQDGPVNFEDGAGPLLTPYLTTDSPATSR